MQCGKETKGKACIQLQEKDKEKTRVKLRERDKEETRMKLRERDKEETRARLRKRDKEETRVKLRERDKELGRADVFGHFVHRDAVRTADVLFVGIVVPRAQDEDLLFCDCIEECGGRFVIIAKAIIGDVDKRQIFSE